MLYTNKLINKSINAFCVTKLLPFGTFERHEETFVVKVASGDVDVNVDGARFNAKTGDVVIISPFVLHAFSCKESGTLKVVSFALRNVESAESNVKVFAPIINSQKFLPCLVDDNNGWHASLTNRFDELFDAVSNGDNAVALLQKLTEEMHAHRLTTNEKPYGKKSYTMQRALEYVKSKFTQNVSVKEIADYCGYSEFYMMKLFKGFCGCTTIDYLNNYRVCLVAEKLLSTDDNVSVLAREVGFNNVSYFNRCFKRVFGTTPKEYKQQNKLTN